MNDHRTRVVGQQAVKAHVTKAQLVMTGAHLLLPVGAQGKQRAATPDRVLPESREGISSLGEVANEVDGSHRYRLHRRYRSKRPRTRGVRRARFQASARRFHISACVGYVSPIISPA